MLHPVANGRCGELCSGGMTPRESPLWAASAEARFAARANAVRCVMVDLGAERRSATMNANVRAGPDTSCRLAGTGRRLQVTVMATEAQLRNRLKRT